MFTEEYRETLIRNRLKVITIIVIVAFSIMLLRIGYLQIMRKDYYVKKATGNRLHPVRLTPPRGMIYDRYADTPLVDNETAFDVCILPDKEDYIWKMDARRSLIFNKLGIRPEDISKKIKENRGKNYEPIVIKENIDSYLAAFVSENNLHVPELIIRARPARNYEKIAPHIIGYTAPVNEEDLQNGYAMSDMIGRTGLESTYESYLRGDLGWRMVEVNTFGQVVRELPLPTNIRTGENLYLTLDRYLQKSAEEIMQDKTGVLIALDPRDGGILAMVSKPDFDPSIFTSGNSCDERNVIMNDPNRPLLNRAIMGEYPPGSTFKIISATAALTEGKITEHTYFHCSGGTSIGNRFFRCHSVHGSVSIRQALPKSCNVFFYNVAYRTGLTVELLNKYAKMFGLGDKTGIDLPGEKKGNIPEKSRYKTDNVNMVIGQGAVLVTPIQMANVISVIANRGFSYKPHFVDYSKSPQRRDIEDKNEENQFYENSVINKPEILVDLRDKVPIEVIDLVRDSLLNVAKNGLCKYAKIRDINICGKTGTAQNPHGKPHAWYIGFAPYENPRIVVVALIENSGLGSENAAPIAGQLFAHYFKREVKSEITTVAFKRW